MQPEGFDEELTLEEKLKKYDEEFAQLDADREYCEEVCEHMKKLVDECLRDKVYDRLFEEVKPYFEDKKKYPRFTLTAEIYRIYVLLWIIELERRYGCNIRFESFTNSYNEYMEQYILTVFAMRRLELGISEEGMEEAESYLRSIPLSVYAAGIIAENEKFEKCPRLYLSLYKCMSDRWTVEEKIFWLQLLNENDKSQDVLLELASLNIEPGYYEKAYNYLLQIESPTEEISEIIESLKAVLGYL